MCEAKFTKGNWTLHRVDHDMTVKGEVHVVASDGYPSAFIPSWNDDNETALEAMANAHLIAVAPEMYEELQEISNWMNSQFGMGDWHKDIEKLLSKARGENV